MTRDNLEISILLFSHYISYWLTAIGDASELKDDSGEMMTLTNLAVNAESKIISLFVSGLLFIATG